MPRVIGVRFRRAGKIYHFDPGGLKIERGTNVIVETARGLEMGQVVIGEKELPEDELVMPLKKVLRLAGEADLRQVE
jgi:cell fate regulator YaaT (PSP1 superfamily)